MVEVRASACWKLCGRRLHDWTPKIRSVQERKLDTSRSPLDVYNLFYTLRYGMSFCVFSAQMGKAISAHFFM